MSIEQRLNDALADLEGALAQGLPIDQAVSEISCEYELKPEVLRQRGEAQFGNLSAVAETVARSAARVKRASQIKGATYRQCRRVFDDGSAVAGFDIVGLVEAELGFKLSADEMLFVCHERNQAFHRKVIRDIGTVLPSESLY